MNFLRRTSGMVSGPPLLAMRFLYVPTVRPIICYGCAICCLRGSGVLWPLSNTLMKQLISLEYQCLKHIAGAFAGISKEFLNKELHLQPLNIYLESRAESFRAQRLDPDLYTKVAQVAQLRAWKPLEGNIKDNDKRPYAVLDRQARILQTAAAQRLWAENSRKRDNAVRNDWMQPKVRAKFINACAREGAELRASENWRTYKKVKQTDRGKDEPALWDEWGKKVLGYYRNMPRAQTSILLQCRTGVGGLRAYLHRINVSSQIIDVGSN